MILCLWYPLHPLSKLLAKQDHAQNLEEQLWMGGRREVSVISHRPMTSSDWKHERLFFRGSVSVNILATGCLIPSYLFSRGARLLNRVKRGALFALKGVVIKNSISFSYRFACFKMARQKQQFLPLLFTWWLAAVCSMKAVFFRGSVSTFLQLVVARLQHDSNHLLHDCSTTWF